MKNQQVTPLSNAKNEIVVYQPNETIRLEVVLQNDTVWLTQEQMCRLFVRDQSVISRHIGNVFKEGELDRESNMHFLHIANSDKYHVGCSMKDAGRSGFAVIRMETAPQDVLKIDADFLLG